MLEKESRDRQLKEEKTRKRREDKEAFANEVELVQRLRDEMAMEKAMQIEKRRQEKEYLMKMLRENEANKAKAEGDKAALQRADMNAQNEYSKLLDKQEADRQHEFQQREARAQNFMNKLAGDVIGKQQERKRTEDEALMRYEMEKEMRARLDDEKKAARIAAEKVEMRKLLGQQCEEKRYREAGDKADNDQQAEIWRKDKENYELEEQRLQKKIKSINLDNQDFLQNQMGAKQSKTVSRKMDKQEFAYNKQLLKEINDKKKQSVGGSQYDRASQHASQVGSQM